MKSKRNLCLNNSNEVIIPPAYPLPGYKLFAKFRDALAARAGKDTLFLEDVGSILGVANSTSHDWFCVSELHQVQALLCLMERTPDAWCNIIRPFLRDFPNLHHRRLAKNPKSLRRLKELLSANDGLSVIEGGTEADRSFVLTALGHAFLQLDRLRRRPAGMDMHTPRRFVPIDTLIYFRDSLLRQRLRTLILEQWRQVRRSDAPLFFLNGVLTVVPGLLPEVLALAKKRHVVIEDSPAMVHKMLAGQKQPVVRRVELLAGPGNSIQVQVELRPHVKP